mgnify:CR=1 FL=1
MLTNSLAKRDKIIISVGHTGARALVPTLRGNGLVGGQSEMRLILIAVVLM